MEKKRKALAERIKALLKELKENPEKTKKIIISVLALIIIVLFISKSGISFQNLNKLSKQSAGINEEKAQEAELLQIAEIVLNPENYTGKRVKVRAKIEDAVVIGDKAYITLFDGTARIVGYFNASRENILKKKWFFLVDTELKGMEIEASGILRTNAPIFGGESGAEKAQHGVFAYLIEIEDMKKIEKR